jgi:hypothetical protein
VNRFWMTMYARASGPGAFKVRRIWPTALLLVLVADPEFGRLRQAALEALGT